MKTRFSLGLQLGVLTLVAVAVILAAWSVGLYGAARAQWRAEMEHRAYQYAGALAGSAKHLTVDPSPEAMETARQFLDQLLEFPGVVYVGVYGPDQTTVRVLPHKPFPAEVGRLLTEQSQTAQLGRGGARTVRSLRYLPVPVRDAAGKTTGWVKLWYSADATWGRFSTTGVALMVILICVTALVLAGVVYAACSLWVFRPLGRLLDQRWDAEDVPSAGQRELDLLVNRFQQISRRQREAEENLSLLLEASKTIASEASIREISNQVLDLVWQRLDHAPCLLWKRDEDGFLRIKNFRNFPPDVVGRLTGAPGQDWLGAAFETRFLQIVADIRAQPDPLSRELAAVGAVCAVHLPWEMDGKSVGVLTAASDKPDFFSAERLAMLSSLLDYLSLAAKNARLFEEMQAFNRRLEADASNTLGELSKTNLRLIQRVRELRGLYDATALTAQASPQDAASKVLSLAVDLVGADRAAIFLAEEQGDGFRTLGEPLGTAVNTLAGTQIASWKAQLSNGETVFLQNTPETPAFFEGARPESLVLCPLRAGGHFLGFVAVADKRLGVFDDDDTRVLNLLARHLAEKLWGVKLDQDRELKLRDLTTLQEVSSLISEAPDLDEVLRQTAALVAKALDADLCIFHLYEETTQELVTQPGAVGLPPSDDPRLNRVHVDDPLSAAGRVFLNRQPFLANDLQKDPHMNPRAAQLWGVRSMLVAPLISEKRCVGVLRLGHKDPGHFTQDHLRLASLVAKQAGALVQNARLYRQVQEHVQELKNLNRTKSEFVSIVSHELRTPITVAKGFVAVLLTNRDIGPLTPQQERFLTMTSQSIERLSLLINDLLDISQVEAGRLEIEPVEVKLAELLQQAHRDQQASAEKRKVRFVLKLDKNLPGVTADPHRLRQVVDNLLNNALKFTPEGGSVTLSAALRGQDVLVGVRDTGMGLPPEERERVFEKFYQVDAARARASHGAGLGLAIAKSLVELHGGRIWVESEPGKGAHFQFVIPLQRKQPHPPVENGALSADSLKSPSQNQS